MLELAIVVLGALGLGSALMPSLSDFVNGSQEPDAEPEFGEGFRIGESESGVAMLYGREADDEIDFTALSDAELEEILGLNNVQMIAAGGGDDVIRATLEGGEIYGGAGNDVIENTSSETTTIYGMEGDDTITATGADIFGGEGNDTITTSPHDPIGDPTIHQIEAGTGDDTVTAEMGHAVIHGREGDDTVLAGRNSAVFGGAGDDEITLTDVNALAVGGEGDDTLRVELTVEPDNELSPDVPRAYAPSDNLDIYLQGGAGADHFDINATLNHVQGGTTMPTVQTTITDFTPGEDTITIDFANNVTSQGDILNYFNHLADNPGTPNSVTGATSGMAVSYTGLEVAADGSYTDIIFTTTGVTADGPVTQEIAFRLEGVNGLDPSSVTVAPDGTSLTIV